MAHDCRDHLTDDYVEYDPQEATVKVHGECWRCHRPLVLLYDYAEMEDAETGEVLDRTEGDT